MLLCANPLPLLGSTVGTLCSGQPWIAGREKLCIYEEKRFSPLSHTLQSINQILCSLSLFWLNQINRIAWILTSWLFSNLREFILWKFEVILKHCQIMILSQSIMIVQSDNSFFPTSLDREPWLLFVGCFCQANTSLHFKLGPHEGIAGCSAVVLRVLVSGKRSISCSICQGHC